MRKLLGGFAALILAATLSACGSGSSSPVVATHGLDHIVTVYHDQSLNVKIDAGRYDWVNANIRDIRFSPDEKTGTQTEAMAIFSFNQNVSSETAVEEMGKPDPTHGAPKGYRPATLDDLLAFGATISEFGSSHPIIALDSSAEVGGDRSVPELWLDGLGYWSLDLDLWDGGWSTGCRFLAVRN